MFKLTIKFYNYNTNDYKLWYKLEKFSVDN